MAPFTLSSTPGNPRQPPLIPSGHWFFWAMSNCLMQWEPLSQHHLILQYPKNLACSLSLTI